MHLFPVISRLLTLLFICSAISAADVDVVFNVDNTQVAPDGFTRTGVIVNGVFPGTLIQANKDDTLHIAVNDQLTDPTMRRSVSIHWHGLFQSRTGSEDGPAFVNQCPIAPGHSYTYDIPLNGQAGTFWYHSHLSSQYVDGLRGALVVYDPIDPHLSLYDVDDASTVITLADWYHNPAPGMEDIFLAGNDEPIPDSGLINGIGRYVGGPQVVRARVNVEQGKRYRFRVVNISAYAAFRFSIEGHDLTIIEVDGISHVPLTVGGFDIYAAQRYSVVLNANKVIANYWIRGPMTLQHSSDNKNLDTKNVYAVLHYSGASDAEPTTKADVSVNNLLQEYQLAALVNPGAPGGSAPADRSIDLKFSEQVKNGKLTWDINDISYLPPDLPTLLNIMANGITSEANFTATEHTFVIERNEVVELVIHGSSHGHIHPFHLHGHAFDVVQSMQGPANYINPPRRDVVGSTVIIRFQADNPGPWFLHCHIDWHLEAGLAVVFAERPAEQISGPQSQIIKQSWLDLCPIYKALPLDQQ
ncbi:laccase 16 [Pholiota conissans]|uniref:Laccase 16 n=1 Tax=Pholiota conissans TaxID=109636 RepID=A0A9P5Z6V9_9AGAR|nr:laccase 16 [Pholiota conissans]